MKYAFCYLVSVLLLMQLAVPIGAFNIAPSFTLDLDKPPSQRWEGAVAKVMALHSWDDSFGAIFNKYHRKMDDMPVILVDFLNEVISSRYPDQYEELDSIAKQLRSFATSLEQNLTVRQFAPWVYFYEFGDVGDSTHTWPPNPPNSRSGERQSVEDALEVFRGVADPQMRKRAMAAAKAFREWQAAKPREERGINWNHRSCTGLLALPKDQSKEIIHGRNMDESPAQGRNCTLNITVMRNGTVLYYIYDWTWMTTGFYTGSSIGGVTLEENWREHGYLSIEDILAAIADPKSVPTIFMFRHILENQMDFDQTLDYLNSTTFAAPFYAIVSGTGRRGAVVTAAWNHSANYIAVLDDSSYPKWYMVQTNYDRWEPDPTWDPRRTVAEQHFEMIGHETGGSLLGVWMVASVFPVHNTGTMYTALMGVDHPPEGYIRVPMVPMQ